MKQPIEIGVLSDTHGPWAPIAQTIHLDAVVHCGDFVTYGDSIEYAVFSNRFESAYPDTVRYLLPGNHDMLFEQDIMSATGLTPAAFPIHDRRFMIGDYVAYGSSWQPAFRNWAFNVESDEERYDLFQRIPDETEILFTHCPPYMLLDELPDTGHIGDKALARRIRELTQLKVNVFGHIHGCSGYVKKEGITYVNASLRDEHYHLNGIADYVVTISEDGVTVHARRTK